MVKVNEIHLFPVVIREYHKPEDDLHEHLIEYFKTYPAQPSNFPEGVLTSRPDLHKDDNIHVKRLIEFFDGYNWRQVDNTTQMGRAILASGTTGSYTTMVGSVQIMSQGNEVGFGDLTQGRSYPHSVSSGTRAVFGGGMTNSSPNYTNSMNFVTIATTGNGIDFGDIPRSDGFAYTTGASDSHGGLAE